MSVPEDDPDASRTLRGGPGLSRPTSAHPTGTVVRPSRGVLLPLGRVRAAGPQGGPKAAHCPSARLFNDSHLTWSQIVPELARDRRAVFVLDLPGHGHSDRPDAGYELAWYARIVAGWIELLGLAPRERVDIAATTATARGSMARTVH